jgi:flagellar hook-length control protein FliK
MTAIAFGAALIGNEAPTANAPPSLPQLPALQISGLPIPALPVTPIRFGEQLRQSLDMEPLQDLPTAPRVPGELMLDEQWSEQSPTTDEDAIEALPAFPGLITFTQPVTLPLEYAQRSSSFQRQPQLQASLPVAPVSQPAQQPIASRDNALLNVLAAISETSALGALTINPATLSLASKGTLAAVPGDNQTTFAATQLASLTNAGLAQALVQGMTQQPGVLAPVATPPAQPLTTPRSALEVALGDRLQLQITQRSEHAVIRLDPPSMGTIEIVIQREAGNIQVHLRASNAEVARQLHGIGDSLRQDLIHRQQGEVSVHVADTSREQSANQQGQRQSQAQREAPGRALSESNEESSKPFTLAVDEERGA